MLQCVLQTQLQCVAVSCNALRCESANAILLHFNECFR